MTKSTTTGREVAVESYRLISVAPTAAPDGVAGDDWFVYRIAQGKNEVTGYRRGTRYSATAEVERIVEALNERLLVKGHQYRSASRRPKPLVGHEGAS